ncbi:MAG: transporter substrate-binding protein [Nocardioides sp.]|jgi:hypothetical protein|uniref:flavin reductase family protein n=1 Tax=Nocardioides sp. TaxID=35761 RepID=UPI002635D3E7|nr:hypothetical protein [Nocardioides sp.]MCW2835325.1 transporter substrate-binding protein [Nocardioides sp.]
MNYAELADALGYYEDIELDYVGQVQGGPEALRALATDQIDFADAFQGAIAKVVATGVPVTAVVASCVADPAPRGSPRGHHPGRAPRGGVPPARRTRRTPLRRRRGQHHRRGAVTLDEGLARFDCAIYREVEAGDHTIVILKLHAVAQEHLQG